MASIAPNAPLENMATHRVRKNVMPKRHAPGKDDASAQDSVLVFKNGLEEIARLASTTVLEQKIASISALQSDPVTGEADAQGLEYVRVFLIGLVEIVRLAQKASSGSVLVPTNAHQNTPVLDMDDV